MRRHEFKQRDEDIAMPSGSDGWVGYTALVIAVGCVPLGLAALANNVQGWAVVSFVSAVVLFVAGVLLIQHSEKHEGPHIFDRGMAVYKRRPRPQAR